MPRPDVDVFYDGEYIKGLRSNVAYTVNYKGESTSGTDTTVKTEIAATRKGLSLIHI